MIKLAFRGPMNLTGLIIKATKGPTSEETEQIFGDDYDDEEN